MRSARESLLCAGETEAPSPVLQRRPSPPCVLNRIASCVPSFGCAQSWMSLAATCLLDAVGSAVETQSRPSSLGSVPAGTGGHLAVLGPSLSPGGRCLLCPGGLLPTTVELGAHGPHLLENTLQLAFSFQRECSRPHTPEPTCPHSVQRPLDSKPRYLGSSFGFTALS